jgi:hypothetical protein
MTENIPTEWRDSFGAAIAQFYNWHRNGGTEPYVRLGRHFAKISEVCNVVWEFTDPMPDNDYQILCIVARDIRYGQMVPEGQSYDCGARSLQALIEYCRTLHGQ